MTLLARLGARGLGAPFDGMLGNALGALAMTAGHPHEVPLGSAQRAVKVPIALRALVHAHDARDRQRAAGRADARNLERRHHLLAQSAGEAHPVSLQRRHDERRHGHLDLPAPATEERVRLGFEPLGRQVAHLGEFSAGAVGNVGRRGNALAEVRGERTPGGLARPAARLDGRHAVRARARELCGIREGRVERRERRVLGFGDRRHQIEVIADRVADRPRGGELPQTTRAGGKRTDSFRKSDPWNRQFGESLNLTGF